MACCRKIAVGDPRDSNTWMGPLISREHEQKVRSYLKIAKDEGLKFCCGETVDELNLSAACQRVRCCVVIQGGPKKVSLIIFAITCLLPANFHNFWHVYTIENLQPELFSIFWTHKVHYKLHQSRLQNFDDGGICPGGLLSVHPIIHQFNRLALKWRCKIRPWHDDLVYSALWTGASVLFYQLL